MICMNIVVIIRSSLDIEWRRAQLDSLGTSVCNHVAVKTIVDYHGLPKEYCSNVIDAYWRCRDGNDEPSIIYLLQKARNDHPIEYICYVARKLQIVERPWYLERQFALTISEKILGLNATTCSAVVEAFHYFSLEIKLFELNDVLDLAIELPGDHPGGWKVLALMAERVRRGYNDGNRLGTLKDRIIRGAIADINMSNALETLLLARSSCDGTNPNFLQLTFPRDFKLQFSALTMPPMTSASARQGLIPGFVSMFCLFN